MIRWLSALIVLMGASLCHAQLTVEQKQADLRQLSSLYAKYYGPLDWKRQAVGFDLLALQAWQERAAATQDDLEFLDLLSEYVSSLNDAHDVVSFPFNFSARLGFSVDLYDWTPLIDSIDRVLLPAASYPFTIGDELVSVDGVATQDWIMRLARYSIAANARSTVRSAVSRITSRDQARIPWAHQIGDTAEVVIRRTGGDLETYQIPWTKTGYPVTSLGPTLSPLETAARRPAPAAAAGRPAAELQGLDAWQRHWLPLLNVEVDLGPESVLGSRAVTPVFSIPGLTRRLGRFSDDFYYSGVYSSGGLRIGYLRIPTMNPAVNGVSAANAALAQLDAELYYLEANTDGLVVDVMRNPGGSVAYVESLAQRLIPYEFRSIGFAYRPIAKDIAELGAALKQLRTPGAVSPELLAGYEAIFDEIQKAYRTPGALTAPISLTNATLQLQPASTVYTKPLILLADGFSASGADALPAILQDAARGPIVGARTMGAGGNVVDFDATSYTEARARVTRSLMVRKQNVVTSDYPEVPYVENIGVRPDVEIEYMTRDNLLNAGRPFVEEFTRAIVAEINRVRGN